MNRPDPFANLAATMIVAAAFCVAHFCVAQSVSYAAAATADWPMWRYDAGRSAASPHELPAVIRLQWTRQYSARVPVWDDPLNRDLMPYDTLFEPIVMNGRVFVGFNDADKVVALDLATGAELWVFRTDGPVRLPPVGWQGKIFFSSDDGYLYCVAAADGKLLWKFRGGPSNRKVLGNGRVTSLWPARGGPVLRDGTVYFAASIWPFLGTFIYALDAETGQVQWLNDGTSATFIKQPHSAPAFAGVAPQGALVATKRTLLVPSGRSVPAAFDRATGRLLYFHLNAGGKGTGGTFLAANDSAFFVHTRRRQVRRFDLATGVKDALMVNEPVLVDGGLYTATEAKIQALNRQQKVVWEVAADGSGDLIRSGRRLYAAGAESITAIALPKQRRGGANKMRPGKVVWSIPVDGQVRRLLAGGGKLLAVTLDGRIMAFGAGKPAAGPAPDAVAELKPAAATLDQARALLERVGDPNGYALWFGVDDGKLLEAVIHASNLHIVAVDPDAAKVKAFRRRWDEAAWYGKRLTLHQGDPLSFHAPPYIAHLVVVGESVADTCTAKAQIEALYASVRPYGGVLRFPRQAGPDDRIAKLVRAADLPSAEVVSSEPAVSVYRQGPLPGSAPWTHQYGNIANTVKSDDALVKPPFGILWYGGNSNMDVLPRHGHGPPEQVVGGRLFIEGVDRLNARDVYTGRVLWQRIFDDLGTANVFFDRSYKDTPLSTSYNQQHIPGANTRGTNFIATAKEVYVAKASHCLVLDAVTGKTTRRLELPARADGKPARWAYIGVYEDILLAGTGFANYTKRWQGIDAKLLRKGGPAWSPDHFGSLGLVAFNRRSGEVLWQFDARHSFLHNGIVAGNGRLYCLDKLPKTVEKQAARRGRRAADAYRLLALDVRTGKVLWETTRNVFGSWLGYSAEHDILLEAGAAAKDRSQEEVGQGMAARHGRDGTTIWQRSNRQYVGPCIIHHDHIITNSESYDVTSGVYHLLDGSPVTIPNPFTGKPQPWRYVRSYGCNTAVASEHLLTFRSGAAGYYDLAAKSGTANLGGFRSGCTSNLIAADGVLNAPDYTRTCTCGYQNQTSLALIHMAEAETWSMLLPEKLGNRDRLRQIGLNLGAPGGRRAGDGLLWIEYPPNDEVPLPFPVEVSGAGLQYFRRHSSAAGQSPLPWVASSGVRNIERIRIRLLAAAASAGNENEVEAAGESTAAAADPPGGATTAGRRNQARPAMYTVRLHFCEPDAVAAGQRVFDVVLQGKVVRQAFDVVRKAGGTMRGVVAEFRDVAAQADVITVRFVRRDAAAFGPVLSGIELIAQGHGGL